RASTRVARSSPPTRTICRRWLASGMVAICCCDDVSEYCPQTAPWPRRRLNDSASAARCCAPCVARACCRAVGGYRTAPNCAARYTPFWRVRGRPWSVCRLTISVANASQSTCLGYPSAATRAGRAECRWTSNRFPRTAASPERWTDCPRRGARVARRLSRRYRDRVPPVTRYAKRGNVSIAYQVFGDGPFDVVFVPGFISHLDMFWEIPTIARMWQRLASFARVITFDKRGTGLSEGSVGIPTLEERMDDLHAVMDAVGSKRAALVGISEGGPMSLTFAAMHPDRTIALVLWGSFARVLHAPDYPVGMDETMVERSLRWVEKVWGTGQAAGALIFSAAAGDSALLELVGRAERSAATPATALAALQFGTACDIRDVLSAIAVPT